MIVKDQYGQWEEIITTEGGRVRMLIKPSQMYRAMMSEIAKEGDKRTKEQDCLLSAYDSETDPLKKIDLLREMTGVFKDVIDRNTAR